MLRYLFVDITLYDSRLFYAYTGLRCLLLFSRDTLTNVRLDVRERVKVRASVCLVVRFFVFGLFVYIKRKHKKRPYTFVMGLHVFVCIHVHLHSYSCC